MNDLDEGIEDITEDRVSIDNGQDVSHIANFFKNRSVFITGATGFVGKALLEKLLYACSGVRTVYILLRPKEGQDPRQRLDELLTSQVFQRIKRSNPTVLTKVVPVSGDITLPELGLSRSDTAMLAKHVSVVFHSAATVRFDDPLKKAVDLNLIGTQRVLELCKQMTKLAALIHVSTAYSYCNRDEIEEKIYPERVPPEKVIEASQWMEDDLVECILPRLLDGRPTTYHYTKALAETFLIKEGENLPIAIVRPSIVTAAVEEPIPGWIDGMNGPSMFIIATGKGLLRTMMVYKNTVVDWIPVDYLANLLLTVAWNQGTERHNTVKIYNATSGDLNKITWKDIQDTAYPLLVRYPFTCVMRYPGGSFKRNRLLNYISVKLEHSLPAHILDIGARLLGHKPEFVNMVARMERATGFIDYFTTKQWKFHSPNFIDLMHIQSPTDRKIFHFDPAAVQWGPYIENYVLGVRKFLLGEDESSLPAARRKLAVLYYGGFAAQCFCIISFVYLLHKKTNISNYLMWQFIELMLRIIPYLPQSWLRALSRLSIFN